MSLCDGVHRQLAPIGVTDISDTANAKAIVYSEDGKWIAYALANT